MTHSARRRNFVVEPLPGGWCRYWVVVTDANGRSFVGPEIWGRTAKVLLRLAA
jgi:hypothetical protein